jgi:hypothetical protein
MEKVTDDSLQEASFSEPPGTRNTYAGQYEEETSLRQRGGAGEIPAPYPLTYSFIQVRLCHPFQGFMSIWSSEPPGSVRLRRPSPGGNILSLPSGASVVFLNCAPGIRTLRACRIFGQALFEYESKDAFVPRIPRIFDHVYLTEYQKKAVVSLFVSFLLLVLPGRVVQHGRAETDVPIF